jgi:hypothetical protein
MDTSYYIVDVLKWAEPKSAHRVFFEHLLEAEEISGGTVNYY